MTVPHEQLKLYKSLFHGRDDVFAVRWEKEGKTGYTPAHDIDWQEYAIHKANGGTFQNFEKKTYKPLSDTDIFKHLKGEAVIGIYPLLKDNTSWFIAADFDKANWIDESRSFLKVCNEAMLPAYMERSRSGNGAHVWLFFENPYPAARSRKLFSALLHKAGLASSKNGNSSFDRLFPNQDFLSGKGLGNLIALPLNGKSIQNGNSCFINPETLEVIEPQWAYLTGVKRISISELDAACQANSFSANPFLSSNSSHDRLKIVLKNDIEVSRHHLPISLLNYIKNNLIFLNSQYVIKKRSGANVWNTKSHFNLIKEEGETIRIPKGFIGKILRFCKENKIDFQFQDNRTRLPPVQFHSSIVLKDFQVNALEVTGKKDLGIISAPPGSGKTIMGLSIIAEKQQPALILVHRRHLAEQWKERITTFLKIPKHEIGNIGQQEFQIGRKITIAMIQSLSALMDKPDFEKVRNAFGIVLFDECHHIPAETYRDCISQINSYYLYGLTATPLRKGNDEKLLSIFLGEIIADVKPTNKERDTVTILIKETSFTLPFNIKTDKLETLSKVLIHDSQRNRQIAIDVAAEVRAGRKVVLITERREHIETLQQYLKQSSEVITLTGEDSDTAKKAKWKQLVERDFDVLITTGQYFGEGTDISTIDCLFLVYPFSFQGKLIQYIGRVQRGEFSPVIYDYRDSKVEYLEKLFQERNIYYKKIKSKGIKEHDELILCLEGETATILGADASYQLENLGLPGSIASFKQRTYWLMRVLKFDNGDRSLFCEIIDYNYLLKEDFKIKQQYEVITSIRFRSIDTAAVLQNATLKTSITAQQPQEERRIKSSEAPVETVQQYIKVPISTLEFEYGSISFTYFFQRIFSQIKFQITNDEIRPEFEVLKPYFIKALKSKKVNVLLRFELQNNNLLAYSASSFELERINKEIIEAVHFNFIKDILKQKDEKCGPLNLSELTKKKNEAAILFSSEQNFVDYTLKWKKIKHFEQINYLAKQHDISVLKIRFLLLPFSFIFLITGEAHYYLVLETLDTEEATYVWYFEKSSDNFQTQLKKIDEAITQIRSNGREQYLASAPANFFRIIHDYSNPKKGFIQWKASIEQLIYNSGEG